MQTDYIIIGQGISGTLLSWHLLNSGSGVVVIDEYRPFASSRVAAGLVNPVTGLRFAENPDYERLWAAAGGTYNAMSAQLGVDIVSPTDLILFPKSQQEYTAIHSRLERGSAHLAEMEESGGLKHCFNFSYPPYVNSSAQRINLPAMLEEWRRVLRGRNLLIEEAFNANELRLSANGVSYKGITAHKVIFCDGATALNKQFFPNLPYRENKAQVIIARIKDLPRNHLYKREYTVAPWKHDEFWIGASFEREFSDVLPSTDFREAVTKELTSWLKSPFEITGHMASIRASTIDYQPFIGLSRVHTQLGIFNGFGSKALLYAPYYAKQLTAHLVSGIDIEAIVNVYRFAKR